MISKTIGYNGVHYSQTHPYDFSFEGSVLHHSSPLEWKDDAALPQLVEKPRCEVWFFHDQYGVGSKPMTINFSGMNIYFNPAIFRSWVGTRVLTHRHIRSR